MSKPNEEERFSVNMQGCTDVVHNLVSISWDNGVKDINPFLITLAQNYLMSIDKKDLIEIFINHTHNFWDEIRNRNVNFFIEHSKEIFGKLPIDSGNIDAFKMVFTSNKRDKNGDLIITDEDKNDIWDFFHSFVRICIRYVHRVRECYLTENAEGKMVPRYRHNRFPEIKVREHAKKWDIELEIPKV